METILLVIRKSRRFCSRTQSVLHSKASSSIVSAFLVNVQIMSSYISSVDFLIISVPALSVAVF